MGVYFPEVVIGSGYEILEVTIHKTVVAYMCMEDSNANACMIHIYVLPYHRTSSVFKVLIRDFKPTFSKYLKDKGKSVLITGCEYGDKKIQNLIRLFGFELKPYCIGTMKL